MPNRTPPIHPLQLMGVAGAFLQAGRLDGAVLVLLAYHACLRTGEALNAATNHVTWSKPGRRGVLALPLTKSGQRSGVPEAVTIFDPLVAALLFCLLESLPVGVALWRGTAQEFRDQFRAHLILLGIDASMFKPYCLRRGGATAHYIEHHDILATQHRGRWNSMKACRLYVVEGQRELAEAGITEHVRAACLQCAAELRRYVVPLVHRLFDLRTARAFFAALEA